MATWNAGFIDEYLTFLKAGGNASSRRKKLEVIRSNYLYDTWLLRKSGTEVELGFLTQVFNKDAAAQAGGIIFYPENVVVVATSIYGSYIGGNSIVLTLYSTKKYGREIKISGDVYYVTSKTSVDGVYLYGLACNEYDRWLGSKYYDLVLKFGLQTKIVDRGLGNDRLMNFLNRYDSVGALSTYATITFDPAGDVSEYHITCNNTFSDVKEDVKTGREKVFTPGVYSARSESRYRWYEDKLNYSFFEGFLKNLHSIILEKTGKPVIVPGREICVWARGKSGIMVVVQGLPPIILQRSKVNTTRTKLPKAVFGGKEGYTKLIPVDGVRYINEGTTNELGTTISFADMEK